MKVAAQISANIINDRERNFLHKVNKSALVTFLFVMCPMILPITAGQKAYAEQSRAEQSRAEQSRAEQSRASSGRVSL